MASKIINEIIQKLKLEKHLEGGFYKRTYQSQMMVETNRENNQRHIMTSIYYLLTYENPISYFAINQSDLILYYHSGSPLKVMLISESGEYSEHILGPDVAAGQTPQLVTYGNCWKAYELLGDSHCLISEAVAPGFDWHDLHMPNKQELEESHPHLAEKCLQYIK